MMSASHWLLAQARFCGRTHLPLSPNSTTPTVQVIFRYLRPDAPVFNITTVGMVTFRQTPCWYYPWANIILSTSSDTQHLWTWWHFGDHTGLINLSVNNIRRIHTRRSRWYITITPRRPTPQRNQLFTILCLCNGQTQVVNYVIVCVCVCVCVLYEETLINVHHRDWRPSLPSVKRTEMKRLVLAVQRT